jgi:ribosomal protein S18 acetylase RimI-like enzyme
MTLFPGEPFFADARRADHPDRPLTTRGATEGDLPELHRLDRESFPEAPYPYFVLRQLFDVHGDRMLVLDDGESLHGYILFVTTSDGSVSWGVSLGVTRDRRGRGLGRRLMAEALRRLREDGVREALLAVEPSNVTAVALYRSLGFSPRDVRKDYFGPGAHRLIMSLAL